MDKFTRNQITEINKNTNINNTKEGTLFIIGNNIHILVNKEFFPFNVRNSDNCFSISLRDEEFILSSNIHIDDVVDEIYKKMKDITERDYKNWVQSDYKIMIEVNEKSKHKKD